jgi:hypothetical protein
MAEGLRCDFCNVQLAVGRDPIFAFDVPDFVFAGMTSTGGWCACETCAPLVAANNREAVFQRSFEPFVSDGLLATQDLARAEVGLRELHGLFWSAYDTLTEAQRQPRQVQ